jgi:hypothetical protein
MKATNISQFPSLHSSTSKFYEFSRRSVAGYICIANHANFCHETHDYGTDDDKARNNNHEATFTRRDDKKVESINQ